MRSGGRERSSPSGARDEPAARPRLAARARRARLESAAHVARSGRPPSPRAEPDPRRADPHRCARAAESRRARLPAPRERRAGRLQRHLRVPAARGPRVADRVQDRQRARPRLAAPPTRALRARRSADHDSAQRRRRPGCHPSRAAAASPCPPHRPLVSRRMVSGELAESPPQGRRLRSNEPPETERSNFMDEPHAAGEKPAEQPEKRERRSQSTKSPSYPRYWRDIQGDPRYRNLTFDQRGRWNDFLDLTQGTRCPGVTTEEELRRLLSYTPAQWPKNRGSFAPFFRIRGAVWTQTRTKRERDAQKRRFKSASRGGKKGARKRWHPKEMSNRAMQGVMPERSPYPLPCPTPESPTVPFGERKRTVVPAVPCPPAPAIEFEWDGLERPSPALARARAMREETGT